MFEWYWFFAFYGMMFHIVLVTHSLYLHRTLANNMFKSSKPLEYFFRLVIWLTMFQPRIHNWAQVYAARHRKHHATSDTVDDPHSPHHMTFKQMCQLKNMSQEDLVRYAADVETPADWIQQTLHEKYRYIGPLILVLLTVWLFGIGGVVLGLIIRQITSGNRLETFIGNYAIHKLGSRYAGNQVKHDRSTILFPIGILLAGEELHANHHNNSKSPNFRLRWFELDMGYVYAVILSKFKLLTINDYKQGKT
jgi:stearoyl-CoA desaturase (delta-9 desaturase)